MLRVCGGVFEDVCVVCERAISVVHANLVKPLVWFSLFQRIQFTLCGRAEIILVLCRGGFIEDSLGSQSTQQCLHQQHRRHCIRRFHRCFLLSRGSFLVVGVGLRCLAAFAVKHRSLRPLAHSCKAVVVHVLSALLTHSHTLSLTLPPPLCGVGWVSKAAVCTRKAFSGSVSRHPPARSSPGCIHCSPHSMCFLRASFPGTLSIRLLRCLCWSSMLYVLALFCLRQEFFCFFFFICLDTFSSFFSNSLRLSLSLSLSLSGQLLTCVLVFLSA
jgi:hypothetical protein